MRETYAGRFVKRGNSHEVLIPKPVMERLRLTPGDLVVMRLFGPLLIMRRLAPEMVVDVNEIPADALPSAARS